ncbi:flippase [Pediococcus ethanolidurans]|uniref:flippase n=1 Tax=Pediococcus ethanolidurans TaxID=319653 RepID=UPI0021A9D449|nr:flippase [Pediococcus ethanolidurans]MCT4397860.1 flippase [Pediococcus ethanolidurans]
MATLKNYFYNTLYQIFVLLVPLVTIPYISRVLGPSGVGTNTLTSATVQYFVLLANLGLTMYGQREVAYCRENKQDLSKTFWEIETLSIFTTIISLLCFGVFMKVVNNYQAYYLAQGILIIASAADISWFFMGLEKFKITVLRNFVFKIISVIMIFTLVKNHGDLLQYILIVTLTTLLGNLSLWPYLKNLVIWINPKRFSLQKHFLPTLALFIPQIAINIYTVLNKIMLGHMVSVKAAGFFDSSDKIIRMALTLITAFTTVMMPHVANAFIKGKKNQVNEMLNGGLSFAIIVSFPLLALINGVVPKFVPWFFGEKFLPVIQVMSIESFAIIPIAFASILGVQYLIPLNKNKQYTISIFGGAFMNIIVNFPLIHMFQADGAAISTIISETCVTILQFFFMREVINVSPMFKVLIKVLIASVVMYIVVKVENMYLSASFVSFAIEGITGVIVYVLLLALLKLKELKILGNLIK